MWKDKYLDLMFSNDPKKIDAVEGFKLKLTKIPPLYKYRMINDFSIDNLTNDTAYFRKATAFNDPYDSAITTVNENGYEHKHKMIFIKIMAEKFNVTVDKIETIMKDLSLKETLEFLFYNYSELKNTPQSVPSLVEKILNETQDEFGEYNSNISNIYQEKAFVSCFSENPTSMLMWSHYADNHKGIAIEYDFKNLDIKDKTLWTLHPVYYTDTLLNLNKYEKVREHISVVTLASISKSKEWSYENEWRMIILRKDDSIGFNEPVITPTSIILGARVEENQRQRIMEIANTKGIPVKQVKMDSIKYHLSLVDKN